VDEQLLACQEGLSAMEFVSRDSSVGVAADYRPDGRGIGVLLQIETRVFLFSTAFRLSPGHNQPPILWITASLP
jgi:hypothetical protein